MYYNGLKTTYTFVESKLFWVKTVKVFIEYEHGVSKNIACPKNM